MKITGTTVRGGAFRLDGAASVALAALVAVASACSSSSSPPAQTGPNTPDAQAASGDEAGTGGTVDSGSSATDSGSKMSIPEAGPGEAGTTVADSGAPETGTSNPCGAATPLLLTVNNPLFWCSVSVAGGMASAAGSQNGCVASGTVNLVATAVLGFMLGPTPWHDTDGDQGSGEQGMLSGAGSTQASTAMVTLTTGSKCVWVCCPGAAEPCPTTDQCP
jgi:hypothetical protein